MRTIWQAEAGLATYLRMLFLAFVVVAVVGYVFDLAMLSSVLAAEEGDDDDDDDKAGPTKAEAESVAGEDQGKKREVKTFLDNLLSSGVIGGVLLLLSIFMVFLIVNNVLQVRRSVLLPDTLLAQFEQLLNEKKYPEAYQLARQDASFAGRVLAAGLSKLAGGYQKAAEAMQEVGEEENMRMEQRLSYLAMIGTVAPMLGLLGTVAGMVGSFNVIAASSAQPRPDQLAGGISMALMTTLIGLTVAIPAIISFGWLRNRVARLVLEVGIVAEELMSRFSGVAGGGAGAAKT